MKIHLLMIILRINVMKFQKGLVLDVMRIKDDAANRVFLVYALHRLVNGLHPDFCYVVVTTIDYTWQVKVNSSIQTFGAYIEHLPHFFAQGHLLQLFLHQVFRCRTYRIIVVSTGRKNKQATDKQDSDHTP